MCSFNIDIYTHEEEAEELASTLIKLAFKTRESSQASGFLSGCITDHE
jgi:hypothetical protein